MSVNEDKPKEISTAKKRKGGTGRPVGTGRFGKHKTKTYRVPEPLHAVVETLLSNFETRIKCPLFGEYKELMIGIFLPLQKPKTPVKKARKKR